MGKILLTLLLASLITIARSSFGSFGPAKDGNAGSVTCEWTGQMYSDELAKQIGYNITRTQPTISPTISKDTFVVANSSSGFITVIMTIKAPTVKDVQNYTCTISSSSGLFTANSLKLRARPIPFEQESNQVLYEDQPFSVDCNFASDSWFNVTKYTFDKGDGEIDLEASRPAGVELDTKARKIRIPKVRWENRGVYACQAVNAQGKTDVKIRLRLKSPFAAIWPAAGIFLEVLALIVIVLVHEHRRAAKKEANAANGVDEDVLNSADKAKKVSDVRSRNAKA